MHKFKMFRRTSTIGLAAALVDKSLHMRPGEVPVGSGAALVLNLWHSNPVVAIGPSRPNPALLAAAALAKAIKDSDHSADPTWKVRLEEALQLLWVADVSALGDVNSLIGIDKSLFEFARAILRAPQLEADVQPPSRRNIA